MKAKIPRRFCFTECPTTEEGWTHIQMPWGAQFLMFDVVARMHLTLWVLVDDKQPVQDRYFLTANDNEMVMESPKAPLTHLGSVHTQGCGIHLFEVHPVAR